MGAAAHRSATRRIRRALLPSAMAAALAAVAACEPAPAPAPAARAAPRHPIQASKPWMTAPVADPGQGERRDLTPGPNSRISPTPGMAPRVKPADRPGQTPPSQEINEMRRDLRQQRTREKQEPGPPAGTIDRRPGTIHPHPGTIEVPN